MAYSLSVIAPFLDEEQNLEEFLRRTTSALSELDIDFDIILVDDGSQDGSVEVVTNFVSRNPNVSLHLLQHPKNLGIFPSWHTGLAASRKSLSVLIDSDLQNPPEAIPTLLDAFFANTCHFVQGVRSTLEVKNQRRLLSSRALNAMLNLAFGSRARDHKSGFVLGPTTILRESLSFSARLKYGQTFIRVGIESSGYLMHEVETIFFPRSAGNSFLTGRMAHTIFWVLIEILKVKNELRSRRRIGFLETISSHTPKSFAVRHVTPREIFWRGLFFATLPMHTWNIPRDSRRYLDILERSDWSSAEQIEKATNARLQTMLWHVFGRVAYYRKTFMQNGILPSDIRSPADLPKLPMISKENFKRNLHFGLFAIGAPRRKLHKISTSGSTGTPFTTYADVDQLAVRFATTLRAQQMCGWRFGDSQMRLWHQNLGLTRSQEIRERLNALVSRRTFIPAFELDPERLRDLVKKIEKRKPVLLDGYAESFNYLAQVLKSEELRFYPRAVMTSAQILTDQTRREIQQGLNAEVFDKYGAREFSGIAYECRAHAGHHVQWESYIVEILKDGQPAKPGEVGEVLVTDLNNFSVPLIRYRIGDLAEAQAWEKCDCGRESPRIGSIVGRSQALVLVPGGKWLPGTFFAHFFKEYDAAVQQFQVVQTDEASITLRIVKGAGWSEKEWQGCLNDLRKYVGQELQLNVDFVPEIPLLATGKRTPVVSSLRVSLNDE